MITFTYWLSDKRSKLLISFGDDFGSLSFNSLSINACLMSAITSSTYSLIADGFDNALATSIAH